REAGHEVLHREDEEGVVEAACRRLEGAVPHTTGQLVDVSSQDRGQRHGEARHGQDVVVVGGQESLPDEVGEPFAYQTCAQCSTGALIEVIDGLIHLPVEVALDAEWALARRTGQWTRTVSE